MLKKAVITEIIPSVRVCKCGHTVSIDPMKDITICDNCGETLYANPENEQHDSEPESTDSE